MRVTIKEAVFNIYKILIAFFGFHNLLLKVNRLML